MDDEQLAKTGSPNGLARYSATWHLSSNHATTIDGDTATSRSYLIGVHRFEEDKHRHADGAGWYDCTLRRTLEGWRFATVLFHEDWTAGEALPHVPSNATTGAALGAPCRQRALSTTPTTEPTRPSGENPMSQTTTTSTPDDATPDDFTADVAADGTQMPPMPFASEPDQVSGPFSDKLLGAVIDYRYSGGRHYQLSFDHDYHVTFSMPDNTPPPSATGEPMKAPVLAYRAREIRPDLIQLHWIVKQAAIHVSICIDLAENKIHANAMMPPNRWEFFDTGIISSITRS
ncbi:hypothetical protein GTR02_20740 [Kineococcus sp. R8]|uniref:nuclear transport factor 2 family protein n=1 Tax=Kineococcus siccus TaxID=2696567 RepID=UPI001411F26B|nr:hypothetical protein [Kineococcus siccus]